MRFHNDTTLVDILSFSNSKIPQSRIAPFNNIMMHHGLPLISGLHDRINRPASPPVPAFNFNGNIVEGKKNLTMGYRPRAPGLTNRLVCLEAKLRLHLV